MTNPLGAAIGASLAVLSFMSYLKARLVANKYIDEYYKTLRAEGKTLDEEDMLRLHNPFIPSPLLLKGYDCTDGSLQANVPHSHYIPAKRRRTLSSLIDEDISGLIKAVPQFHHTDIQQLFRRCVHEELWGTALNLSEAVEHLNGHIEGSHAVATLQSLLLAGKRDMALQYFTRSCSGVQLEPDLYALLYDAISEDMPQHYAVALYEATQRHSVPQSPTLTASSLKCFSRVSWTHALRLYEKVRYSAEVVVPTELPSDEGYHHIPPAVHRHLLGSVIRAQSQITNVHQVTNALYEDMLSIAPKEAPAALLQTLEYPQGRLLSTRYLSSVGQPLFNAPPWVLALQLYTRDTTDSTFSRFTSYILRHHPDRWKMIQTAIRTSPGMGERTSVQVAKQLHNAHQWQLAAALAHKLMLNRTFSAVPLLARTTASCGRWNLAANMCAQLFARRQGSPTPTELSLCVHSSVKAGKWSSAMFWIERAHARGVKFSPHLYDAAFTANQKVSWDASLSAFVRMRQTGVNCNEDGVRAILNQAAEQSQTEAALDVLSWTDSVEWKR